MKLTNYFTLSMLTLVLPVISALALESFCEFNRECYTRANYPACTKKIDLDKYYEFMKKDQSELAGQIISDKKKCIILSGNEFIHLVQKEGNSVKILIRGQSKTYWVSKDAVYSRE